MHALYLEFRLQFQHKNGIFVEIGNKFAEIGLLSAINAY
ncbi:hypothetical protein THF5H11_10815 [Vibrio jasicida]|uniref:Uncharacterized protein n=1 Tax=Vibrio jasicida TaxID=766224 RepID=A0AAU9QYL6_9VIBR|nr:hypothetical protein THF5H11_10815 [Vibrio jasicida]CAH1557994.1 hypothetical protein THF1C08_100035 [Vibrio jasicida]CAH1603931.1 hypothetical protein THF1A12_90035 [Vibrio jasicida]CAH1609495.1 hypothetical protein THF5G08_90229 [Vibrio jasicida]